MYTLIYDKENPQQSLQVMPTMSAAAKKVRLTKTPIVVCPLRSAKDLEGVPLASLDKLYGQLAPGAKRPRKKADIARDVFKQLGKSGSYRTGTKRAKLIGMLRNGATVPQMEAALGWQPHTVRGAISALRRKGHKVECKDGTYRMS